MQSDHEWSLDTTLVENCTGHYTVVFATIFIQETINTPVPLLGFCVLATLIYAIRDVIILLDRMA